jgi:dethiobiotin synthetase
VRPGLLVTGTDTGVGKTFVAAGLARVLRSGGIDVGVMKPAETGHDPAEGPWPADARTLALASECGDAAEVVVPYTFGPPVAPLVAARREGRLISVERIADAFERILARHAFVLVEGAGGLAVPLAEFGAADRPFDFADLALHLDLPLLVVARAHLGTLNHTALTLQYARLRGVTVAGVVVNGLDRSIDDPSTPDNPTLIEEMESVPVLGVIERVEGVVDLERMASAVRDAIHLDGLRSRLADLQISLESTDAGGNP